MKPLPTFQSMILALEKFWADRGALTPELSDPCDDELDARGVEAKRGPRWVQFPDRGHEAAALPKHD